MSEENYNNNDWYMDGDRKIYVVNRLFEGIFRNAKEVDVQIEKPKSEDGYTIGHQDVYTLNDGMNVELCYWWMDGMSFWDLSVDREEFDNSGNDDFLTYLHGLGVYLCSVLDRFACQWRYCGIQPNDKVYRIQYYLENEDDD